MGLFGFELQNTSTIINDIQLKDFSQTMTIALEDNLEKPRTSEREFIFNSLGLKDKKEKDALGLAGGIICSLGYGTIGFGITYILRDYTPPIHYFISIPCLALSSLCTISVIYDLALRHKNR